VITRELLTEIEVMVSASSLDWTVADVAAAARRFVSYLGLPTCGDATPVAGGRERPLP